MFFDRDEVRHMCHNQLLHMPYPESLSNWEGSMPEQTNPWLIAVAEVTATVVPGAGAAGPKRPHTPQAGVVPPEQADSLPRRTVTDASHAWLVGAHGGAGESTYAAVIPGTLPADHAWPVPPQGHGVQVLLMCRSSATGLLAAKYAITDWASGNVLGVDLVGLAIVADAPGRLPHPLRELAHALSGAVPRVWSLPWSEAARLGERVSTNSSREVRSLVDHMSASAYNQTT
jgi:hypothetical protein